MNLSISSNDYDLFSKPTRILQYDKIEMFGRKVLRCLIENSIIGQDYGYGGEDINILYLTGRFDEEVHLLIEFPIYVHVFILDKSNPKPREFKEILHGQKFTIINNH